MFVKQWTDDEDRILVSDDGAPLKTIAAKLDRSVGSIKARRNFLRIKGVLRSSGEQKSVIHLGTIETAKYIGILEGICFSILELKNVVKESTEKQAKLVDKALDALRTATGEI